MILGVTGSRTWKDRKTISGALDEAHADFPAPSYENILIEGGASGADTLVRIAAHSRGWHVATMKALWASYGKQAGHIRNDGMIHLARHADRWLAFIDQCEKPECLSREPHDSHGAAHCAERAELAGIEVRRYGWRF